MRNINNLLPEIENDVKQTNTKMKNLQEKLQTFINWSKDHINNINTKYYIYVGLVF